MRRERVMTAFRSEAERLAAEMLALPETDFDRPTNCPPWTVRELLAHVRTAVGRVLEMLAGPAPEHPDTDAVGYFRAGPAFSPETDAARIAAAQREAAGESGHELAVDLDTLWRTVDVEVAAAPADRTIATRHGDPMLLDEFLATRVVELVLHGFDLATSLGRLPWTTSPAADLVEELLGGPAPARAQGWDQPTFLWKATGRMPLTPGESFAGVRLLTLGRS